MNSVIWKALKRDGSSICEEQNGKYNNFLQVDKKDWIYFSICNKKNNANYSIDLISGTFMFNGIPIIPAIQNDVYDIPCINRGFQYCSTLFWYNEFVAYQETGQTTCQNVYIGYVVELNIQGIRNNYKGKYLKARPMLKLNTTNNMVSFSTSYSFQYTDQQNNIKKIIG